jgi:hypothetical protein
MLDYSTSVAVAAAPHLLDFPKPAKVLFNALGAGYTGMSAFTDYPLGAKRMIPFKGHGVADVVVAAALPAMPWLLGFADHKVARNLCFGLAAMTLVISALTDWNDRE